jgi:beta-phosphoglucomutase-like phosphatase (HAD superfamily)
MEHWIFAPQLIHEMHQSQEVRALPFTDGGSIKRRRGSVIKAVLCDIDGTLVDSNWLHAVAWRDAFEVAGIQIELEAIRRQIGKGGDELIPVFVPWWKRKPIEAPLKRYRQFVFRDEYLSQVKPFPMVRELLQKMKDSGLCVSLASSAHQAEGRL